MPVIVSRRVEFLPGQFRLNPQVAASVAERVVGIVLSAHCELRAILKDGGMLPAGTNHDPDSLVEAVLSARGSIRTAAAWALRLIGDSRGLPILLEIVMQDHDTGSIVPALERILTRDRGRATEADLRIAATLKAPHQFRYCGPDGWFGPGQWAEDLQPLDLERVHQLAQTELSNRGLAL